MDRGYLSMKKIVLITDGFPYGCGEKSFIWPELEYLVEKYDITIVSRADRERFQDSKNASKVDSRIKIMHCENHTVGKRERLRYGIFAILSPIFRRDIADISSSPNKKEQVRDSLDFFIEAYRLKRYFDKHKELFNDSDTLYYSYWYNSAVLALLMKKRKVHELQILTRAHGYDLYHERMPGGRQPYKKYMDRNVDKIVLASREAYEYYKEHYASDISKCFLCELGVKGVGVINDKRDGEIFHIVSCSNVIAIKRVDLIVKALALIDDIDICWTHFGIGKMFEDISRLAYDILSDKKNISYSLMGYVKNEEIVKFYEDNYIDCFLTTSSTEGGCPVSIQEAMSAGIPIVGTDVGGIPSMIEGNGILLPADPTVEEIKDAILHLMEQPLSATESMRRKSRQLWSKRFSIQKNVEKIISVIEK